jgi:hypothetical protein
MNAQEQLLYVTDLEIKRYNFPKIRGVTAYWQDNTACISFYFQGEIIEEDIDSCSDVCTTSSLNFLMTYWRKMTLDGIILSHFPTNF